MRMLPFALLALVIAAGVGRRSSQRFGTRRW